MGFFGKNREPLQWYLNDILVFLASLIALHFTPVTVSDTVSGW